MSEDRKDPLRARPEVVTMTPYRPPTEGRSGRLRLDFNENTVGCSAAVLETLKTLTADDLATYPEYSGILETVARHFGLDRDQLLLTNGIDDAIRTIYWTYLNPGDVLVLPSPTFALFEVNAQIAGARIERVPYRAGNLAFPFEEVLARLGQDPAPRILVLVNPNNPTGTGLSREQVVALLKVASRAGTLVILDEAYREFAGRDHLNLIHRHENLLVLRTFSKAYGLAGLRVGLIAGAPRAIREIRKVLSPYGVNVVAVRALAVALNDQAHVSRYVRQVSAGRIVLQRGLDRLGVVWRPSSANFLLAEFGAEAPRVCEALREDGVLVRDRSRDPLTRGCLRLGIGTPAQCRTLIRALGHVLQDRCILFDLDGVLVDVSESYRAAIASTVAQFAGEQVSQAEIHEFKNRGAFSDDWALTLAILRERGIRVPLKRVRDVFQRFYLGDERREGFRERESWLMRPAILARLSRRFPLGIVTARPLYEAQWTLDRFGVTRHFSVVIAREQVEPRLKPDPAGLLLAQQRLNRRLATYVGDSTSDIAAALAAAHQAIGVVTPGADPEAHAARLREAGADAVLTDVNRIEDLFRGKGRIRGGLSDAG